MMDIGRVCIKIAGRDAGKKCVIVNVIDDNFVLIDGETRRRKCNVKHLEPLLTRVEISQDANREEVAKALGVVIATPATKQKGEKPITKRSMKKTSVTAEPVAEKKPKAKKAKPKADAKKTATA